ncbi:MAG TPA: tRNA dihydrouridine synthase DusB [Armatimonadota bacterium]|jgi:nifR3 family TIM-barrel protein
MIDAFYLRSLRVDPPVALAPLAGYTSVPMRLLSRRAGAGLVCSELLSATGLHYGSRETERMMAICPAERPVGIQLFGSQPEWLAEAAQAAVRAGADFVDLNLGCSVPKVVKSGAGAALLSRPDLTVEIVRQLAAAVAVPVTVKMRPGRHPGDETWLDLAVRMVEAGAAGIALHARSAAQKFTGRADWSLIARLVREVPVPVIGNGDVDSAAAALRMFEETGCAGVMIGRAALGNPWIFAQVAAALRGQPPPPPPTVAERVAVALCHAQMQVADYERDERSAILAMRPLLVHYMAGLPGVRTLRAGIMQATQLRQVRDLLLEFAVHNPPPREIGDQFAPYTEC